MHRNLPLPVDVGNLRRSRLGRPVSPALAVFGQSRDPVCRLRRRARPLRAGDVHGIQGWRWPWGDPGGRAFGRHGRHARRPSHGLCRCLQVAGLFVRWPNGRLSRLRRGVATGRALPGCRFDEGGRRRRADCPRLGVGDSARRLGNLGGESLGAGPGRRVDGRHERGLQDEQDGLPQGECGQVPDGSDGCRERRKRKERVI